MKLVFLDKMSNSSLQQIIRRFLQSLRYSFFQQGI